MPASSKTKLTTALEFDVSTTFETGPVALVNTRLGPGRSVGDFTKRHCRRLRTKPLRGQGVALARNTAVAQLFFFFSVW
jgi:hypothetical protein